MTTQKKIVYEAARWGAHAMLAALLWIGSQVYGEVRKNTEAMIATTTQLALLNQRFGTVEEKTKDFESTAKTLTTANLIQDAKLDASYKDLQNMNGRITLVENNVYKRR